VLSRHDSRAAPQTVQTASPVCGTKNFSSVRLYSAPQLHCTIVAIPEICASDRRFSSPELCHNRADPQPTRQRFRKLLRTQSEQMSSGLPLKAEVAYAGGISQTCRQVRTWPLSPMRCVSGVAAWIVTNKADGFGLSFSATDAEYAWGVDRVVDDRTITMSRSSFRRKGGSTVCA